MLPGPVSGQSVVDSLNSLDTCLWPRSLLALCLSFPVCKRWIISSFYIQGREGMKQACTLGARGTVPGVQYALSKYWFSFLL